MDHLTTLDAGFLKAEDADSRVSLAIGGLAVIEGPAPRQDALVSVLAERIRACPRFGQRLKLHPFDLGAPEWVDDPDFEIERHVRRVALPQPGNDHELYRVIADVMARRLDRDRPLWEVWVIEGLTDERWAILTKIHHCMADGIAATHVLAGLCDDGMSGMNRDGYVHQIHAARESTQSDSDSLSLWTALWNLPASIASGVLRTAQGAGQIAAGLLSPVGSPLTGHLSDLRRYSGARVPLADIELICQTFDVTLNDVALTAITESYRNVLLARGQRPYRDSLRTLVPVSVRSSDAFGYTDNRVSLLLPNLPVDEENPVERLQKVHARLGRAKASGQRQAGNVFVSLANRVPFALSAWAVGLLTRLPQRGVVTVATNVPGPRRPLRLLGRRVLSVYPIPPLAMHLRTGVAMLSYADELYFGILADYDAGDVDQLARGIEAAVARLVAISKRRKAPRRRGPLSLVV
ncbi:wax ester/triacylglycerol synthase family O-acyltransferase [Mycobacterium intermedium]|uniref:Diacylglycerol O-acyltransferase n=1 Tax=Mycobacterium intermedium TaxID=28445 RepID=A0A1E3SFG2_MYCIE|nr:wax ester/triacylglycerol synthase family O-acyltransferase [Mycobacterium intermedium]MCV6966260.1 wax ester/triacylglycerol synthase family O-acyltransferase [Mycobacterium intermedium]ODR00871.1 diacylglycerol O-acyltransferase [Mycobacterium intermedium]OPE52071.1 diacylglycerol O-acyltransferase [Mycobacterium intermedium]ORB09763.1 wax ester/triacylglycerol synthase family O-acyltransferase [Mycobacterium intermedium]